MKTKTLFFILALYTLQNYSQTLHVEGKDLITTTGQNIVLRGINYPIIDEGLTTLRNPAQYQYKIQEAAKTGANAIRLPWYTDGTHFMDILPYGQPGTVQSLIDDGTLSALIGYCHQQGMIPILEIHDATCSNDYNYFNTVVVPWWQQPAILNIIEQHKAYLIVNIANEFGFAGYTGNAPAALQVFKNNYIQAVTALRNSGIQVPLMIDAPDCGTSSSELLTVAPEILDNDPAHNIIFSAHAYWIDYANTQAEVNAKLSEIDQSPFCYILGEVANIQDENGAPCLYDIENIYHWVLTESCTLSIPWLAWTYTQDICADRRMTTNGVFNTLTPYGNDLVYNPIYGLVGGNGCSATPLGTDSFENSNNLDFTVFPNPGTDIINISNSEYIDKISSFYIDLKREKAKRDYEFATGKVDSLRGVMNRKDNQLIAIDKRTLFTNTSKLQFRVPTENLLADKQMIRQIGE